jgi:putative glutamine amidotransferase
MQLANAAYGGTLIAHLPTAPAHGKAEGDAHHDVQLEPYSMLATDTVLKQNVNSSHHQALSMVAPVFRVTGRSPDGVIETIEWSEPGSKPFFLGVQWHPERMDPQSPMSARVASAFLSACAGT